MRIEKPDITFWKHLKMSDPNSSILKPLKTMKWTLNKESDFMTTLLLYYNGTPPPTRICVCNDIPIVVIYYILVILYK